MLFSASASCISAEFIVETICKPESGASTANPAPLCSLLINALSILQLLTALVLTTSGAFLTSECHLVPHKRRGRVLTRVRGGRGGTMISGQEN